MIRSKPSFSLAEDGQQGVEAILDILTCPRTCSQVARPPQVDQIEDATWVRTGLLHEHMVKAGWA